MRFLGPFLAMWLPACATAPITQSGSLTSYQNLVPSDGMQTKSLVHVNKQNVLSARTVRIIPTRYAPQTGSGVSERDRILLANVVDRSLCHGLSERFKVVDWTQSADLSIRATITQITPTDEVAAGVSAATKIATSAIDIPGPVPRLPIGLGSLTIEAEALNQADEQDAAMVWARGANSFMSSPKVSKIGDAYDLGSSFGSDFSQLLITGQSPFETMQMPHLPSVDKMRTWLGGKPKHVACETYGRNPGLAGMLASPFALPPGWTDAGGKAKGDRAMTVDQ